MSLPLSFITEPRITASIEVSRMQGDVTAGCHIYGTIEGTAFIQLSEVGAISIIAR